MLGWGALRWHENTIGRRPVDLSDVRRQIREIATFSEQERRVDQQRRGRREEWAEKGARWGPGPWGDGGAAGTATGAESSLCHGERETES